MSPLVVALVVALAPPQEDFPPPTFAFVPRITLDADNGLGLGVRGNIYWNRRGQKPYKTALFLQAFATTKLVQQHFVGVDALDAFQLPLRIQSELGYFQSRSQNFCGLGGGLTVCDLEGTPDRFKVRYLQPYLRARVRWRLAKKPHQPELFVGARAHFYQPGDLVDDDGDGELDFFAYPGSLYDEQFPGGERGLASIVEAGAILDNRDHEPDPRRGYLLLVSARVSDPLIGSAWRFAGVTAEGRLFAPLSGESVTLASRVIVDQMFGDAPIQELARVGSLRDMLVFGGVNIGRGVRVQRYMGRFKAMGQHEVRVRLDEFQIFGQDVQPAGALFLDAGVIAMDPLEEALRLVYGVGVSFRIAYNKNFTMRLDIGFSPDEGFRPAVYSSPGYGF